MVIGMWCEWETRPSAYGFIVVVGSLIFVFDSNIQCKRFVDAHVHVWFFNGCGTRQSTFVILCRYSYYDQLRLLKRSDLTKPKH